MDLEIVLCFVEKHPGAQSPWRLPATSSASLDLAGPRETWRHFCWNEKIGRAALDNSTAKHCGRRFGLHTKAARVLIAFSVITKKAPNYFLHVLRMTGFCSANSKHRGIAWKGDARFEKKKKSVEVKMSGRQLVLNKDLKMNCFIIGTCRQSGAG